MNKNNNEFNTITHAKCIIAGEHAVLRGHSALVFPIHSKNLRFNYRSAAKHTLKVDVDAPYSENFLLYLWGLIENSLKILNRSEGELKGEFALQNNIPMGSGMGFSSAICVAITKWLIWNHWLEENELFNFARLLENGFHGKSSGVDIAGVLTDHGILFSKNEGCKTIKMNWKPYLYISSSQQQSATVKCIKQVEEIWQKDSALAEQIDMDMAKSVAQIEQALLQDKKLGFINLVAAIKLANSCFERWGLISPKLRVHSELLLQDGAKAVKPTGSGAGGYVLSLWETPPPSNLSYELIPLL